MCLYSLLESLWLDGNLRIFWAINKVMSLPWARSLHNNQSPSVSIPGFVCY